MKKTKGKKKNDKTEKRNIKEDKTKNKDREKNKQTNKDNKYTWGVQAAGNDAHLLVPVCALRSSLQSLQPH